ncbi:MAG: hypothetical protein JKX84_01330 [Flavobacteriales bacterium]|nr:hypothetical protein [Flavobacteriales bacterium]
MTFSKATSFILLLLTALLSPSVSMAQSPSKFDYSNYSFAEADVFRLLEDSTYLGLSYQEITSMQPKVAIAFCKKHEHSISQFIVAQITAEADIMDVRSVFLENEAKRIYDEIDKKLGIKK